MSNEESGDREVFIVHSKGDLQHDKLFTALVPRLADVGLRTWKYDDWSWEHRVQRQGRGDERASGSLRQLDYQRYKTGHPMPFRGPIDEVDEVTLAQMMHGSSVVILCEPTENRPSEGVARERIALAGLSEGPMLLHLLWPGSDGALFRPLRPTDELRMAPESDAAVGEVFAFVATAWLVHTVQRRFGGTGGHRLMKLVADGEPTLSRLILRSPRFGQHDSLIPEPSTNESTMAEMLERLRPFHAEEFEEWWATVDPLRAEAAKLGADPAASACRALIAAIDQFWRTAFG